MCGCVVPDDDHKSYPPLHHDNTVSRLKVFDISSQSADDPRLLLLPPRNRDGTI